MRGTDTVKAKVPATLQAVVYTRVSSEEQAENNTSLEDQRRRGLLYAEAREFVPVKVLEDAGVSGARYETRTGLKEAIRLIESGQAHVLIVTKIDRLARKTKILLDIAERIANVGGLIVTCDGMELGGTPIGRLMLTLLGAIAEFERENIRERMMRGSKCRAEQGVQPNRSKSPYGYHVIKNEDVAQGLYPPRSEGSYVLIEEQASWARKIYAWYDQGESLRGIAERMNDTGTPPPKTGKCWYASSVRSILENPVYKGSAAFGRQETISGEHLKWMSDPTRPLNCRVRRKRRPEEEWTTISTPAIIDADLWARCAVRLQGNADDKKALLGGNPLRRHLLTGLTRCPSCGWRMGGSIKHVKIKPLLYYECSQNRECTGQYRHYRGDLLHGITIKALLHLAEHPASVRDALRAYEDHMRESAANSANGQENERMTTELARLNKEIDATRRAMVKAMTVGLREEEFTEDLARLASAREKVEARLQTMTSSAANITLGEQPSTTAQRLSTMAASIIKVFDAGEEDFSTGEKQALLTRIIEYVKPTEEGAEIAFRSDTVHFVRWEPFLKIR